MKGIEKNTDLLFIAESFKIFFEKVLNIISDPSGIAIQEWLKYKDVLASKEATPQGIYLYAQALNIAPQSSQTINNQMIKLKRVQHNENGNGSNCGTPKKITRRASFGQESPNAGSTQSNNEFKHAVTLAEGKTNTDENFSGSPVPLQQAHSVEPNYIQPASNPTIRNNNNNQISDNTFNNPSIIRNNQQDQLGNTSPWVDKKRNQSPAKRMNIIEVQQLKGLSDFATQAMQLKQNDQFEGGRKMLMNKVKLCIEMFKKDTIGLDLIHDRSFQTQTMLGDSSKRKPFERNAQRSDSKFIREFSIYSKKAAPVVVAHQMIENQQQQQQGQQLQYQQNVLINNNGQQQQQQQQQQQYQPYGQNYVSKTPTPLLAANVTTTNNTFGAMGGMAFDFVKAKNTNNINKYYNNNNNSQSQKQPEFQQGGQGVNMIPSYNPSNIQGSPNGKIPQYQSFSQKQQQQQQIAQITQMSPSYQPQSVQQYQNSGQLNTSPYQTSGGISYQTQASPHTPNTFVTNSFQISNGMSGNNKTNSGSGSPPGQQIPATPPQRAENREIEDIVQRILKEQKVKEDQQAAMNSSQRQGQAVANNNSFQQNYMQQQQQQVQNQQFQAQQVNKPSYIQMNFNPINQNSNSNNIGQNQIVNYPQSSPGFKSIQKMQ